MRVLTGLIRCRTKTKERKLESRVGGGGFLEDLEDTLLLKKISAARSYLVS